MTLLCSDHIQPPRFSDVLRDIAPQAVSISKRDLSLGHSLACGLLKPSQSLDRIKVAPLSLG